MLDDDKIDVTWVFKSTSDDYKSLKLVSQPYELVIRYEKYINDGEYFEAQKRVDDKANESASPTNVIVQNQRSKEVNIVQSLMDNYFFVAVSILLVVCVVFVAVTIIKKRT